MRTVLNHMAEAFRFVGECANLAALLAFVWATLTLKDMASEQFRAAGSLPALTTAGLKGELSAIQAAPETAERYWHLGAAWFLVVAAAGCAWMALLGARWAFHFVLRLLNR